MVSFIGFRSSRWDPVLIVIQIITVQSLGYFLFGALCYCLLYLFSENIPISAFFNINIIASKFINKTLLFVLFISSSVINALLLYNIVERSRRCFDFTVTFYFIHFVATWGYSRSFPTYLTWWALIIISGMIMINLGRYLCMKKELLPIPLAHSFQSQSEDLPGRNLTQRSENTAIELDILGRDSDVESSAKINKLKAPLLSSYNIKTSSLKPDFECDSNSELVNTLETKELMRNESFSSFSDPSETSELEEYLVTLDKSALEPELQSYLNESAEKSAHKEDQINTTSSNPTPFRAKSNLNDKINNQSVPSDALIYQNEDFDLGQDWEVDDDLNFEQNSAKKLD
ncbi:hypothetical protein BB560_005370 [Smittium megazygosporum]|uniref:Protein SYS1 n=1 Tax=Smittium megazygosporum TaxID=133381 RepID=A0A2T9Z6T7_9FUNG|nr:hypothetical protein BB560_005370 [Smittium megazygosporum]